MTPTLELVTTESLDWFEPDGHTGVRSHWIVTHADAARVQLCEMAAGGSADSHVHEEEEQVFHVLDGALEVSDDAGTDVTVGQGESVRIPAGVPHATRNTGAAACRYVVVTSAGALRGPS